MKVKENRETLPKRTLLGTPTTTKKNNVHERESCPNGRCWASSNKGRVDEGRGRKKKERCTNEPFWARQQKHRREVSKKMRTEQKWLFITMSHSHLGLT